MQLVEVVLFFIYLHAAASEYAMHCEERNRQWAEHRGDPVRHCEKNTQQWKTTASRPDLLPSQHGNLKLCATERLQARCKADLVFAHAWTLHTRQFNSQSSITTHRIPARLFTPQTRDWRALAEEQKHWVQKYSLLITLREDSGEINDESSVDVHSSSSCSKPIYDI